MIRTICMSMMFLAGLYLPGDVAFGQEPESATEPVSAEKLLLAEELLGAMRFEDVMNELTGQVLVQMDPLRGRTVSKQDEVFAERLKGSMKRGMSKLVPELVVSTTENFARAFTEQELRDGISFYSSPSGQAHLQKGKIILAETVKTLNAILPKYVAYTEEDYCAQVTCGDTEQRLFGNMQEIVAKSTARPAAAE